MDFNIPSDLLDLQLRTRAFIRDQIIPYAADPRQERHGPTDELRRELNALARQAGLLSPHVAREYGGLGLSHVGRAVVFEEAGYSVLGPLAMNISAPDEGNMHLLEHVATPAAEVPLARPPGPRRHPLLLRHDRASPRRRLRSRPRSAPPPPATATDYLDPRHQVVHHRAPSAPGSPSSWRARPPAPQDGRATMLLADMDQPGIRIVRAMDSMDQGFAGGHAVLEFDGLRVPAADVLGEPGQGFRSAGRNGGRRSRDRPPAG